MIINDRIDLENKSDIVEKKEAKSTKKEDNSLNNCCILLVIGLFILGPVLSMISLIKSASGQ